MRNRWYITWLVKGFPYTHFLAITIYFEFTNDNWSSIFDTPQVMPIHKKSTPDDPSNYLPISVLPTQKSLNMLPILYDYLERYDFLKKYQFGYRKNRSTQNLSKLLLEDIRSLFDKGIIVFHRLIKRMKLDTWVTVHYWTS